jgi:hypothetical protein
MIFPFFKISPSFYLLFIFAAVENLADKKTHCAGKMEAYTPNAEKQRNKGLDGLGLKYIAEATCGAEIVIQAEGEYVYGQCQKQ